MKNKTIFIAIVLLLAGGVGYYIWQDLIVRSVFDKGKVADNTLLEQPKQTKEVSLDNAGIEQNAKPNIPAPDLNRPINVTENLDEAAKKAYIAKINETSMTLKKKTDSFDDWLVLGIYRKAIGDYKGAKEIWEYTAALRPGNFIPFNNLGDLYAYFLKDNKKAEENFNKAIELSPNRVHVYYSFYDFYRYVLKDDAKAKALLQKGIAANPGSASQGLQDLLNNH